MKKQTIFKIAFCVLLVAALVYGALDLRPGRNTLHATFAAVRNGDFTAEAPQGETRELYMQRLKITLVNDNDYDVTVLGLRVERGDERDFRVERTPEQAVTIPAHTSEPQNVWFHIVSYDSDNDAVLAALRKEYAIRLVYADAASGVTSPDAEAVRTEWVR